MAQGLGEAEVDDLGQRLAVLLGHQDIVGLQVPVEDGLLVGVLDRVADLQEQGDPLVRMQGVAVAVVGDGHAGHQLHDEVGHPLGGGPGVEDLGDARVSHDGQGLPFSLEAADHLGRIQARPDQFEGHPAHHGHRLLGQPDLAHPAHAQGLQEVVGADLRAARDRLPRPGSVLRADRLSGVVGHGLALRWEVASCRGAKGIAARSSPQLGGTGRNTMNDFFPNII